VGAVIINIVDAYLASFSGEFNSYDVWGVYVDLSPGVHWYSFVDEGYCSGGFFGWVTSVPAGRCDESPD